MTQLWELVERLDELPPRYRTPERKILQEVLARCNGEVDSDHDLGQMVENGEPHRREPAYLPETPKIELQFATDSREKLPVSARDASVSSSFNQQAVPR